MRRLGSAIVLLTSLWVLAASAAQRSAVESPPVFRLTIELVQLDAVVTDSRGRHVTTLGREDFDVLQDRVAQPVTAVTYVDAEERWEDTSGLPPLVSTAAAGRDGRRAMVIVVDRPRLSFESVYRTRLGLQAFVDRRFRPGDLAMLLTTDPEDDAPREFTPNPVSLRAQVARLRYAPRVRRERTNGMFGPPRLPAGANDESMIEEHAAVSALWRLGDAVAALKDVPGRKTIVLISEGFSVFGGALDDGSIRDELQRLVDRSNRAGVVLYAIDPRGVSVAGLTAADNPDPRSRADVASRLWNTQDDLRFLTGQTGGFAVLNNNDLESGLDRIIADQRGYYLIGYQPAPGTIDEASPTFRNVKISVKRKGLKVRTRAGFYGVATE